jgi:hypothetical protein
VFQAKGQVLFGRSDEALNPRFAGAIFNRAVAAQLILQKAAISHGKSSRKTLGSAKLKHSRPIRRQE